METKLGDPAIEQQCHERNLKTWDGMEKVGEKAKQPSVPMWQRNRSNISRICLLLNAKSSK